VALFVDLKAVFDSVDMGVLKEAIRERGDRERLVKRVEEVMRETKSWVRVGGKIGETFRTVRQGCLSTLLFNILLTDMEEEMGRVRWGGIMLGEVKVYTLAYADDVILLVEDEKKMRSMIERFKRYFDRKKLELTRIRQRL
jgi:hypothetical protein